MNFNDLLPGDIILFKWNGELFHVAIFSSKSEGLSVMKANHRILHIKIHLSIANNDLCGAVANELSGFMISLNKQVRIHETDKIATESNLGLKRST